MFDFRSNDTDRGNKNDQHRHNEATKHLPGCVQQVGTLPLDAVGGSV